eukprot:TRINITY_DN61398_c0_g1_i1.p1 TRINITY_DN61398_c0_g1~~TRINITY_DN61398_c0_g1_i1.p1  ORF type:complete len:515 (+),score=71.01 TRINITY_DN61398_c0_g1_i1:47-1591(+)
MVSKHRVRLRAAFRLLRAVISCYGASSEMALASSGGISAQSEGDSAKQVDLLVDFMNYHMFGEHALTPNDAYTSFSTTSPETKVLCQLGLGQHSGRLFELLVGLFPQFEVVVLDANFNDPVFGVTYFQGIEAEMPGRVLHSTVKGYGGVCDIFVTSLDVPFFTIHSVLDVLRRTAYSVLLFETNGCSPETREPRNVHACQFLQSNWKVSICGDGAPGFSGCKGTLCVCFAMTESLMDPVHVPINCSGFTDVLEESFHGTSQWHQDWFYYHNFLKYLPPRKDGIYVDIGAYDPFLISSTATFEQCFGWRGVCVEPNPRLVHNFLAYRSCDVFPVCVWNDTVGKSFELPGAAELGEVVSDSAELTPNEYTNPDSSSWNQTNGSFSATCHPLQNILMQAGITGQRIDFLSVDVEHGEVAVFEHFPFEDWDIRMIVVETNRDTAFAVDVLLLSAGYTKLALLGKDAVYAHARLIEEVTLARGTFSLTFPAEMQRYTEPYKAFQRRFLTGDFKGEDFHF